MPHKVHVISLMRLLVQMDSSERQDARVRTRIGAGHLRPGGGAVWSPVKLSRWRIRNLGNVDPASISIGEHNRFSYCLRPHAMPERWQTWAGFSDGADKFPCLIIAERAHRITRMGITGRAFPSEKLRWHGHDTIRLLTTTKQQLMRFVKMINRR